MATVQSKSATRSRDQNGAEARVLESAIKLFSEKGYSATTIREIIAEAGVTRPVLYYYFKNKEDLFSSIVESQFATACGQIDEILASSASCRARLKTLICATFERVQASPEIVKVLLQFFMTPTGEFTQLDREELGQQRFARISAIMAEGLESGELQGGDADYLAMVFGSIMDMHVMAYTDQEDASLSEELGEKLVNSFMDGAAGGRS